MNFDANPKADNIDDSYSQQESLPVVENGDFVSKELEFEQEARPYNPSRGRRAVVIVAGMILAGAVLALVAMTFMQGSWWHDYGSTDEPLDRESHARIEEIRDQVAAYGTMPEVVAWLDEALAPGITSDTAHRYLLAAQESLEATGDQKLIEAAGELRSIVRGSNGRERSLHIPCPR